MQFMSRFLRTRVRALVWQTGIALGMTALGGLQLAGCAGNGRQIVASPLSISDQQQEIARIVPLGTNYETARTKLAAAGIECSTSEVSKSGLWCVLWNRPDGQRWMLDVKLLFDAKGRFYQMQQGQSETGQVSTHMPGPTDHSSGETAPAKSSPGARAVQSAVSDDERPGARGTGNRTPFGPRTN